RRPAFEPGRPGAACKRQPRGLASDTTDGSCRVAVLCAGDHSPAASAVVCPGGPRSLFLVRGEQPGQLTRLARLPCADRTVPATARPGRGTVAGGTLDGGLRFVLRARVRVLCISLLGRHTREVAGACRGTAAHPGDPLTLDRTGVCTVELDLGRD